MSQVQARGNNNDKAHCTTLDIKIEPNDSLAKIKYNESLKGAAKMSRYMTNQNGIM